MKGRKKFDKTTYELKNELFSYGLKEYAMLCEPNIWDSLFSNALLKKLAC